MFSIINRQLLEKNIKRLDISAKSIAQKVQPGQFVVIIPREKGEWIPLTVVESDERRGIITVIFKEIGQTTRRLGALQIGKSLFSVIGPLGKPAAVRKKIGTVICVAMEEGIASMLSICRALKRSGNKVIGVIGAVTQGALMLEPQMRVTCNKIFVSTEDGSYERKGNVTGNIKEILAYQKADLVYAIGPVDMMQVVCRLTKEKKIPTLIQVNSIISCGTGRCGSCRTKVGSKILSSCQHGPEFNGHEVDFEQLRIRTQTVNEIRRRDGARTCDGKGTIEPLKKIFSGLLR